MIVSSADLPVVLCLSMGMPRPLSRTVTQPSASIVDVDAAAEAGHRLVDRVVDDLEHQVVQAALIRRADVHAGAPAHRLQPLQHLDVRRRVRIGLLAALRRRRVFRLAHHVCCCPKICREGEMSRIEKTRGNVSVAGPSSGGHRGLPHRPYSTTIRPISKLISGVPRPLSGAPDRAPQQPAASAATACYPAVAWTSLRAVSASPPAPRAPNTRGRFYHGDARKGHAHAARTKGSRPLAGAPRAHHRTPRPQLHRSPARSPAARRSSRATATSRTSARSATWTASARAPMADDTIFRIYSMTKPITSVALMTLYEQGHFQLNDPVHTRHPRVARPAVWVSGEGDSDGDARAGAADDLPPRPQPHRRPHLRRDAPSGRPRLPASTASRARAAARRCASFVEKLAHVPLRYDPGDRWMYSLSTDVCGYLVEAISGMPLRRVPAGEASSTRSA